MALAGVLFWMAQALAEPVLTPYGDELANATFDLTDLGDTPHALTDYRGRVVLVNFWATWCPSCIKEMPDLERLADTFADEAFEILTVNVGEPKFRVWKFVKLVDFDLPVLLDTRKDVFRAWDLEVLPTSFLLDRDGRIRYRVLAAPHWDSAETLSVIRKLLKEQETTQ
jgi:thiol-disulfide isomerase/thioredoxin